MVYTLLLLQLSAHFLSDFIFQPHSWSDQKAKNTLSIHHVFHLFVVWALCWLLSLDMGFWKAAVILAVSHLLIDILKTRLIIRYPGRNFFFLDQFLHVAVLVVVVLAYNHYSEIKFHLIIEPKLAAIITAYVFVTKPANIFLKNILVYFSINPPASDEKQPTGAGLENAGKLIGITERILGLTLVLLSQYEAVGLLIAAKSILRFPSPIKSEYVVAGTLLSFAFAILAGILVHMIG
jgi:hypothetical protein